MVIHEYTAMERFLELVEQHPNQHFEFTAQGEIIEVSPKRLHSWIQVTIAHFLRLYIPNLPGCDVLSECAHELNGWPCLPDVSVDPVGDEEIPTVPPLVAVEIKSRSNTLKDQREKARQYLAHGTQMVWLVFPEKRIIEIYLAQGDDQILTTTDTLDGGTVLPGFSIAVSDLFPAE